MKKARATSGAGFSTLIVRGFSAVAEKAFEQVIHAPVLKPKAVSNTSAPIYDMLAGVANWQKTVALIDSRRDDGLAKGASHVDAVVGLIVAELAGIPIAYAVETPISGEAVAAVKLGVNSKGWTGEPVVLHRAGLESVLALKFRSPSVSALLALARLCFHRLFRNQRTTGANLDYLMRTGDIFVPDLPDSYKWTLACCWPDWQRRKLGFPARQRELSTHGKTWERTDDYLRQIVSRDLKLRIGDKTDG